MTAIPSLIKRLEDATEGSRELDWLVAEHLGEIPAHSIRTIGFDYDWWRGPGEFALWKATDSEGRSVQFWQAPQVSTSLDAAVALAERLLPGCEYEATNLYNISRVTLHNTGDVYGPHYGGSDINSMPIAFCIAILRALLAQETEKA